MKINRDSERLIIEGEEGEKLTLSYTNAGEPFREGVEITLEDSLNYLNAMITAKDAVLLRDKLNDLLQIEEPSTKYGLKDHHIREVVNYIRAELKRKLDYRFPDSIRGIIATSVISYLENNNLRLDSK